MMSEKMSATGDSSRSRNGLSFRVDGPADAPALVLVNSIGMTSSLWDAQVPAFAKHFRTIRYDQRGHGRSAAPAGLYSIADLGGDVIGLLDELGIRRASICGLSLGGLVAMWLGARHPDRVDKLVVACSSAHPNDEAKWSARIVQARNEGMGFIAEQGAKGWFAPEFSNAHPDIVERLRSMVRATNVEGYVSCCEVLRTVNLVPQLPQIACPTLVIAGRHDRGFPIIHAETIRAGIPDARLVVLEAAHIACVEAPDAFTAATLDHLLELRSPASDRAASIRST